MEHTHETEKKTWSDWHDRNYKKLLIIPAILLILAIGYQIYFFSEHNDFIRKDVSLTGGTSITVFVDEPIDLSSFKAVIEQEVPDSTIREITDFRSGRQQAIVVESKLPSAELQPILESILGYTLTVENASTESTGSTLGESFYQQLIYAIILSFSFMAVVVLYLFSTHWRLKIGLTILTLIPPILFFSRITSIRTTILLSTVILILEVGVYFRYSIPSAAVVISAFADIVMTLAVVNLLGTRVSSAGIIAFLMLIGYSVDSDIMLTTRLLKRDRPRKQLARAFITGMTMTLTSILAITVAFVITQSFSEVLRQIFLILLIGLTFDLLNTWITNASLLKWYIESRK